MRVLHFADSFSPLTETFIYDYVTELERQGVDNHVATFQRENKESRPFPKVHVVDRPSRWHPRRLWRRALVPLGIGVPRTSDWPQTRSRLSAVLQDVSPDVVHAHFGPMGVLILPLVLETQVPIVVSFHGFDAFRLPEKEFWREKYLGLFEQADKVTAVSNLMAEHLRSIGSQAERTTVVRVGKRVDEYPYRSPSAPVKKWISVGRLTKKKGFEDCIEAFGQHVAEFPGSTLDIIGGGERLESIQHRVEVTGLADCVHILGQRDHSEVKRRLRSADAFVLCSKETEEGDREGVPTVLMEAQAIGLPVVSTEHSGIPEVIPEGNRKFLAPEGEVEAINGCLRRIASLSDEDLAQVAKRGRKKIEHEFNLEKETRKLVGIYESLVHSAVA